MHWLTVFFFLNMDYSLHMIYVKLYDINNGPKK